MRSERKSGYRREHEGEGLALWLVDPVLPAGSRMSHPLELEGAGTEPIARIKALTSAASARAATQNCLRCPLALDLRRFSPTTVSGRC